MSGIREELSRKLGFGCMRLPVISGDSDQIDEAAFCRMTDTFLEQGFRYFDTAYPYHNGKSEEAVRRCLVERYARDRFLLADKMPVWLTKEYGDYQKIFDEQLARCGVSWFDFYLLHALGKERAAETEKSGGFDFVKKMKEEGKIRHIGFSFHDTADVLDEILQRHPEMEFVQLQINYYDWESAGVQSRRCYETAVKHGVPVIVMEPVKGGTLAQLTGEPARIFCELDEKASPASYAIRYAASLPEVVLVLSGMSDEGQLEENTSYMREFQPLSGEEQCAVGRVVGELEKLPVIPCTKCRYCTDGCPEKIRIPDLFDDYNLSVQFGVSERNRRSYQMHTGQNGKAGDCIRCGRCEEQCPQHLKIRELLEKVAETFENRA